MSASVIRVTPRQDFTLAIAFDTGEEGVLDMKPYLGFGVFREIADYENFCRVRVSFDTIGWDCGADLAPEFVYSKCVLKAPV